jgi:hypothetical protein
MPVADRIEPLSVRSPESYALMLWRTSAGAPRRRMISAAN